MTCHCCASRNSPACDCETAHCNICTMCKTHCNCTRTIFILDEGAEDIGIDDIEIEDEADEPTIVE